jgi:hypothetical protein
MVLNRTRRKTKMTHDKAKKQSKNNQIERTAKTPQTSGKMKHKEFILDNEDQDQS